MANSARKVSFCGLWLKGNHLIFHSITHHLRSAIMMLMKLIDPEGAKRRLKHRLIRRVYQNKVSSYTCIQLLYVTDTINSNLMGLQFMVALMGTYSKSFIVSYCYVYIIIIDIQGK